MGGIATPELARTVADAGGLGMVALHSFPAEEVASILDRLAATTTGAVGINFLMPFMDEAALEAAASRCRLVELFYGDPVAGLVERIHHGGALACWQVGSADEARAAADAGCDLIVAQGTEAGGHVRGGMSLLPLLGEVLDRVGVPVLAAGGIATGRSVAAVLAAGAAGARVGTRFVASSESVGHPDYIAALLDADGADTVLTEAFGDGWPHAPHRVLRSCIEAATGLDRDVAATVATDAGPRPVPRFSPEAPHLDMTGRIDATALYAGQGVGAVTAVQPAADILGELCEAAAEILHASGPPT